ncbi:MAG: aryl-sulfate sulfotransferase, partial [Rhodospirillales bacterium]|nr:aryl-sulfate sulfotransferase [Rhodospirillales bacterium]
GPVTTTVTIQDGARRREISFDQSHDPEAGLPIISMRAGREHRFWVTITDQAGASAGPVPLTYRTPDLPADTVDMPSIHLIGAEPEAMEPGYTLLSIRRTALLRAHWATPKQAEFEEKWGLLAALDEEGEVVWIYLSDSRIAGVHQLQNGNLFFHHVDFRTIEMDMLGNVVRQFHAAQRPFGPVSNSIPIEAESLHHQPHELENGNFLALTASAREIDNYYTSVTDPAAPRKTQRVVGDNIVEFTPSGEIVWSWNTFDYLDTDRAGYGLLEPYWWVRGFPGALDWTHGNGVTQDPYDGNVMVSLRHQDAIIKIDKKTKEVIWILGDHGGWKGDLADKLLTPVGDVAWPYHGHNPRVTGEGRFVMYDNGIVGTLPPNPMKNPGACLARAVEFEVDVAKMEVRQAWVSADDASPDRVTSWAMGDAHLLPRTGNMLVIDSTCAPQRDVLNQSGTLTWDNLEWRLGPRDSWHVTDFPAWARVREHKRTDQREVVYEVHLKDRNDVINWQVFGGLRAASLYPEGVTEN